MEKFVNALAVTLLVKSKKLSRNVIAILLFQREKQSVVIHLKRIASSAGERIRNDEGRPFGFDSAFFIINLIIR